MNDLPRIHPGDADRGEIEILEQHVVWSNSMIRVCSDRVRFPAKGDDRPVVGDQFRIRQATGVLDGVMIAPITPAHELLLVHLFRHPARMWMREFPRGGCEGEESPEQAARRELSEELGCHAARLISLGRVAPDSGQFEGVPYLFAALIDARGERQEEATEAIDGTCGYTYRALKAACIDGEILDALTICAVLRLERYFDGDRFIAP